MHSTIYPAAQNLIVAARSQWVSAPASRRSPAMPSPRFSELCNVPDDLHLFVYVAVGYPEREFMAVQAASRSRTCITWNRYL